MSDPRVLGLELALRSLAEGRPVVVPNPTPQTYGVIGTVPHLVNTAKGRPPDQEVGVSLHDEAEWRAVAPSLDLDHRAVTVAHRLLRHERVTILAPLREDVPPPEWVTPGVRDGHLMMIGADVSSAGDGWSAVASLWAAFPRLFGSSANRTGRPPVATAAEARDVFGDEAVVVDGDSLRAAGGTHGATTIVRMTPDGALDLYRTGAHDAASGLSPEAFLERLASMDVG